MLLLWLKFDSLMPLQKTEWLDISWCLFKKQEIRKIDTKFISEYSLTGYNVFDTKPTSKPDGLVKIERLF